MKVWFGGNYGLGFEENDMVKVRKKSSSIVVQDLIDCVVFIQEQRKFALKTLHEVGFNTPALEVCVK